MISERLGYEVMQAFRFTEAWERLCREPADVQAGLAAGADVSLRMDGFDQPEVETILRNLVRRGGAVSGGLEADV